MKTQKEIVIEKLLNEGKIDNFYCIHHYILRLGAIIHQLRNEGWEIISEWGEGREKKNMYYVLVKAPELKLF